MGLMGRWMASVDSASNRGDWPLIGVPTVGGAPASLDKSLQESEPEIGSGNGLVFQYICTTRSSIVEQVAPVNSARRICLTTPLIGVLTAGGAPASLD